MKKIEKKKPRVAMEARRRRVHAVREWSYSLNRGAGVKRGRERKINIKKQAGGEGGSCCYGGEFMAPVSKVIH